MVSTQGGIFPVTATTADTEYELVIPRSTKQFAVYTNHASAVLRIAFKTGEVATPNDEYMEIPNGQQYFATDLSINKDYTIYVASDTNSTTVLCHYWS